MDGTSKKIILIIILAVVTAGLGVLVANRNQKIETPEPAPVTSSEPLVTEGAPAPAPELITEIKPMEYTTATITTNMGTFTIKLDRENTPNTTENFIKLAGSGFYDNTKFHRVIKDFMIQGGDPNSKDDSLAAQWGMGGPGYKFNDEIKATNKNIKGSISMANSGPNTNGSQFFINVADNSFLNTKHTVFGQVTEGYDVVEKISLVKTAPGDRPLEPVVITKIELK